MHDPPATRWFSITDEHPVRARAVISESVAHRCDPTSVSTTNNKAASDGADPPLVIKRAMERAKKKAARTLVGE